MSRGFSLIIADNTIIIEYDVDRFEKTLRICPKCEKAFSSELVPLNGFGNFFTYRDYMRYLIAQCFWFVAGCHCEATNALAIRTGVMRRSSDGGESFAWEAWWKK
jgi:hypothetical protein